MPHDYNTFVISRFNSHVKVSESGCHEWNSALNPRGYGIFSLKRGSKWGAVLAHRVAWEIANGPIPTGLYVCHSCDNPRCVNPSHLFIGTQLDNIRDMMEKGREAIGYHPKGSAHGCAKMTEDSVIEIRKMRLAGFEWKSIASRFGIGLSTAHSIGTGRTWKHVDYPVAP